MTLLSFKEFLLSQGQSPLLEKFEAKFVDFGNDLKNRVWITIDGTQLKIRKDKRSFSGDMKYTFCKIGEKYYQIYITKDPEIDCYVFGFTVSDNFDYKKGGDYIYLSQNFSFDRSNYGKALKVFHNIFYIVLEGIKRFKLDNIAFKGSDPDLGDFYNKLVKNKQFQNIIAENGFELVDKVNGNYIFRKVKK